MVELKTILYDKNHLHRLLHDDRTYVSSEREIWVWDCSISDWNASLAAIRSKFNLACVVNSEPIDLPATVEEIFQMNPRPELQVLNEQGHCFLYSRFDDKTDIDFDFSLDDLNMDFTLNSEHIVDVMKLISNATNKPCEMLVEDSWTLLFKILPNSDKIEVNKSLMRNY